MDVILGLKDSRKAINMINNGWFALPTGQGQPLPLTCGPLVSQGLINFRRYQIVCRRPPKEIPLVQIISQLKAIADVKDFVIHNLAQGAETVPVGTGGFTAYANFPTLAEALNFPFEMEVDGETVNLWHRGKFLCSKC